MSLRERALAAEPEIVQQLMDAWSRYKWCSSGGLRKADEALRVALHAYNATAIALHGVDVVNKPRVTISKTEKGYQRCVMVPFFRDEEEESGK